MESHQSSFKAFFEHVSAPCAILDSDLCFVEVNRYYTDTLMRSREELIGKFIWDIFPEEEERQRELTRMFKSALRGTANSLTDIPYSIAVPDEKGGGTTEIWWTVHATPIPLDGNQSQLFALRVENVTAEVQARELADTVAGEMQHRVGNLLSLVLTIARQTVGHSADLEDFSERYTARIKSLSRTHKALTGGNWNGMSLRRLAEQELEAYTQVDSDKIELIGPELILSALEAQAISMALHELATNAVKYGALNQKYGQLRVSWNATDSGGYEIEWHESGLEHVQEPQKLGFGSMILTRILPSQLDGKATRQFTDNGHRYRLSVEERRAWT